jgi:hypothetical protein
MKSMRILAMVLPMAISVLIVTPLFAAMPTTKAECDTTAGYNWSVAKSECVKDPCDGAIFKLDCVNQEEDEKGNGIFDVLRIVLNVLTAGVGVAATLGIIVSALRYSQSRDNAEAMAGAKRMIINIVIGLVVWAMFFAFLQWLLPGDSFGETI